ncbi:intradiol ring-cleavage dioxygenase [Sphingomonas sp. BIUV-7]|uniref:Intradiol ring-cleavage dioxygenase n=1 Tax=Sphingomonas natans TaxID=3063330 RepID=A0ABT8YBY4_9SPHN|nr:intradiol ring-cleavage dioxygenase [Sphingomonas sp. BIUV-7]MDO6415841.1 intradiol ring-cleavage dioxygenase [Sphingomonas sp. BIUV-7]
MQHDIEDHDRGLAHDLGVIHKKLIDRRRALAWFASAGAGAIVTGCGGGSGDTASASTAGTTATTTTDTTTPTTTTTTTTTTTGSYIADPAETAGPYPGDGTNSASGSTNNVLIQSGIVRSDIRPSFLSGSTNVAAGVLVTLTLTLVNVSASSAPLAGYAIYLWHCDRSGNYSLYSAPAESYLRGVQVTDANGQVTFTTIYPGCYDGRWPHIHFEVFASLAAATTGRSALLTSQLAMPSAISSTVYNGASGYSSSISNFARVTLASDNVFGDNTAAQLAQQTPTMTGSVTAGYVATAVIGIAR